MSKSSKLVQVPLREYWSFNRAYFLRDLLKSMNCPVLKEGPSSLCLLINTVTSLSPSHRHFLNTIINEPHLNISSSLRWQPVLLAPGLSPLPPGSGSGHGLVRPSNTALLSIKIQKNWALVCYSALIYLLTSLWTPRVCTFIGIEGQVDEVSGNIYPVVPFTEAPTCPRLHPHLGSSGPVKQKHREWDMGREWKEGFSWWAHRSHHLWVYCICTSFHWWLREMFWAVRFKEAPGFSPSLLSAEFTISMAYYKAKWICKSNGGWLVLFFSQPVYCHCGLINRT